MEGEQFSLCWNNFHSNLSSGFHNLLKDEDLVDVTLAAEGRYLKAHKTILSVCSPYFKELFRVNPCKHPIVILQDVNYGALCSLLQFMYQGEVSVSQEEIPVFMKVAEMLKVKGLTDNSSSDSNGIENKHSFPGGFSDHYKSVMKRPPRPVKKVMRPVQVQQHARPSSSPKEQPPQKKPHIAVAEEQNRSLHSPGAQHSAQPQQAPPPPLSQLQSQPPTEYMEPLIRPKEEPIDQNEDSSSLNPEDEYNAALENADGPLVIPPNWNPETIRPQDTSSPATGPMLLKSGRGQLVMICNGHMYTLTETKENRNVWVCVKKKMYQCEGCITTVGSVPLIVTYSGHNHPQLDDVIKRLQVSKRSLSPDDISL